MRALAEHLGERLYASGDFGILLFALICTLVLLAVCFQDSQGEHRK
jgi:hypothetical protein